jgi:hypothetical protein
MILGGCDFARKIVAILELHERQLGMSGEASLDLE